jgi:hypothetical protein
MITGQKKIKTEYHVVAQMDLDASKEDWNFWVGRGENTDAPVEELQKVSAVILLENSVDSHCSAIYRLKIGLRTI